MRFLVFQQRGFGDLKLQPLRRQAAFHQRAEDDVEQIALLELHRRDIDGDLDMRGPCGSVRASPPQNPFAERHDQAGRFRERDELVGRDQTPYRMPPANQRLDAAELPGFDVDHRLVMQLELLVARWRRATRFPPDCCVWSDLQHCRVGRCGNRFGHWPWRRTARGRRSCSSSSGSMPCSGASAMPMLVPTLASWPSRSNGLVMALMIRSASAVAPSCWSGPPSWMIANSSPPSRASTSVSRMRGFQPTADFDQQVRSPAGCPSVSLTALNLIEVEHHDGEAAPLRFSRLLASSSFALNSARLASPVRTSCRAR